MKVLVISGSPRKNSNTDIMMKYVYEYAKSKNDDTSIINLSDGEVESFQGFEVRYNDSTKSATKAIMEADVWIIGTPIYNSFFSSALKNLFEFAIYKKTSGKIAGMAILAAGSIGFTDVQTLLTQMMSYFGVVTNPKAVFMTTSDIAHGEVAGDDAQQRLKEMVDRTLDIASRLRRTAGCSI